MNDPRQPHLAADYFTQSEPADMAARPQAIDQPEHAMTTDAAFTGVPEPLEEMSVAQLRSLAKARGVRAGRGASKAKLIQALR